MHTKISRKPPRFDQNDSSYFLTFCTFDRKPLLMGDVADMMVENIKFYSDRLEEVTAYTVMPDHVHLLVAVERVKHLSNFLRDLKKHTSKEIKKDLSLQVSHIWQRGTMDHCIRLSNSNEDFENHLYYIFYNSWKHLGTPPKSFHYHNFMEFVEKGWLDINFFSFDESKHAAFKMYE